MYKAIKAIGGYKPGEDIPKNKAEIWLEMYAVPHVEKVEEAIKKSEPEEKKTPAPERDPSSNFMLDDYLGRNAGVVKKNIADDDLSPKQLQDLLEMEKADKKRKFVIKAIKQKLKK